MPNCALNKDTDEPSDWKGTDDDVWYMRWRIYCKGLFAFANRCPSGVTISVVFFPGFYLLPFTIWFTGWSWWYLFPFVIIPVARKWRLMPKVLFALKGKGEWRLENTDSTSIISSPKLRVDGYYLSRIQLWSRWHFAFSWPFLFQFHWYWKAVDVLAPNENKNVDGKYFGGYRGWHRDEDEIFWGDGSALGNPK